MQLSRESLGVLMLLLAAIYLIATAGADKYLVPKPPEEQDLQAYHHLSKRQLPQCLHFFLAEPPQRIQCLQVQNTLPLQCRFLAGQISTPQILTISWFFSRDGIVAQWVQSARFQVLDTNVAFLNNLTVLNPLPGAYFCSVTVPNQIFDTTVLRVSSGTLQTVCLPQQLPTFLQPTTPRCATLGVPINPSTLSSRTELTVSNTINFGGGVTPTPTFSFGIAMTMAVPEDLIAITPTPMATPQVTSMITPQVTPMDTPIVPPVAVVQQTTPTVAAQQDTRVGTIVGAVIGSLVALVVLVLALVACVIIFVKKRERNQLGIKKKQRANILDKFSHRQPSNIEPLLAQPPERPPPVLNNPSPEVAEGRTYNVPSSEDPLPYEVAAKTMPRYTEEPFEEQRRALQSKQHSQSVHAGKTEPYYARPKFYRPGRVSSTSTHIYGDLNELGEIGNGGVSASALETMYISSHQLEPYIPKSSKDQEITEKDLMLSNIETSYASTDFVPSESEEESFVPSGSEEGSLSDEYTEEEDEEEEESTGTTLDQPSSWISKSPATGQTDSILLNSEPQYINTPRRSDGGKLDSTSHEEVKYVNARPAVSLAVASTLQSNHSTKSTPAGRTRKTKDLRRNKSTPSTTKDESSEYTELTRETANYTTVYASTFQHGQEPNLSAWDEQ